MSDTILIKVEGMTCAGCARSVERAVKSVDAAAHVSVDLAAGEVRIDGATASSVSITSVIEKAGYDIAA